MSLTSALAALAHDTRVLAVLAVVALDFVLGIVASLDKPAVAGKFTLAKVANFAKDDLLGKLVPWGLFYVLWKLSPAGGTKDLLSGVETAIYGVAMAAWLGSVATSLGQLGFNVPIPKLSLGSEHTPPATTAPPAP